MAQNRFSHDIAHISFLDRILHVIQFYYLLQIEWTAGVAVKSRKNDNTVLLNIFRAVFSFHYNRHSFSELRYTVEQIRRIFGDN